MDEFVQLLKMFLPAAQFLNGFTELGVKGNHTLKMLNWTFSLVVLRIFSVLL